MTTIADVIPKGKKRTKAETQEPAHGEVPKKTIDELVTARTYAKDASQAYADAIKAQAEKYKLKPAALRKYIAAVEADKADEVRVEVGQIADLLG